MKFAELSVSFFRLNFEMYLQPWKLGVIRVVVGSRLLVGKCRPSRMSSEHPIPGTASSSQSRFIGGLIESRMQRVIY